jgi:hypothetical protein
MTHRVGRFLRTPVAYDMLRRARHLYLCRRRATASSRHVPAGLDHGGLDLCAPTVAPRLLGCPGTPRQHPVSAVPRGYRRPDKMAAPGTCRYRSTPGQHGIFEQSSGLLIRGFGVQVPGGAPVLTWGFTAPGHHFMRPFGPLGCSVVARAHGPSNPGPVKTARPAPDAEAFARSRAVFGRSAPPRLTRPMV